MICQHCNKEFPNSIVIDGKKRNLQTRKFCLDCSPFGNHNTKPNLIPPNTNEKECACCKVTKPLTEFYERPNRPNSKVYSYCKECTSKLTIERFKQNKLNAVIYKGGKCCICGYNKCMSSLDFHHIDPNQKDFSISEQKGMNFEKLKKELDKCICVCRNCHSEIHDGLISLEQCITHHQGPY